MNRIIKTEQPQSLSYNTRYKKSEDSNIDKQTLASLSHIIKKAEVNNSSKKLQSLDLTRKALRDFYTNKSYKLSTKQKKEKSQKICDFILKLPFVEKSSTIAVYKALKQEPCLSSFYSQYKNKVCFPVIQKELLQFYKNPSFQWTKNQFQFFEAPALKNHNVSLQHISIFFIPGACFDRKGNRFGKGYGYYDKTLFQIKENIVTKKLTSLNNKKTILVGVAFAEQIHNEDLPVISHDIPMDLLITDQFILYPINNKKKGF